MTPSITETAIDTALRTFLIAILPSGIEVVRGQANRVPEPVADDYVVFWPLRRARLATNEDTWDITDADPDVIDRRAPMMATYQLDVHGENGCDNAQVIASLWRDDYAIDAIDGLVLVPLYCSDGQQMPFINGEKQYEDRWVITAHMQLNPVISTAMQFADTVQPTIEPPVGAH